MNVPRYRHRPIGSVDALASRLGFSSRYLYFAALNAERFYTQVPNLFKPDGTPRRVYRVSRILAEIHARILTNILYHVDIPHYLKGGVKGCSPVRNARLHLNKVVLLREDVQDFFSSIDRRHVKSMWKHLFNFPESVAEILTCLTTYNSQLPQGAKTSTYLSNLVFWDKEPILEASLRRHRLTYTRYVDDVNISSDSELDHSEIKWAKEKVRRMFLSKGLRPHLKKSVTQRRNAPMLVHNLVVNSHRPTLTKHARKKIVEAIAKLQLEIHELSPTEVTYRHDQIAGQISYWRQVDPKRAMPAQKRLRKIVSTSKRSENSWPPVAE